MNTLLLVEAIIEDGTHQPVSAHPRVELRYINLENVACFIPSEARLYEKGRSYDDSGHLLTSRSVEKLIVLLEKDVALHADMGLFMVKLA